MDLIDLILEFVDFDTPLRNYIINFPLELHEPELIPHKNEITKINVFTNEELALLEAIGF